MSNTVDIQALLKKHNLKDIAKRFEHVARMGDIDDRLKAVIKEIAEAIVDKCGEVADVEWIPDSSNEYLNADDFVVNKQSIENVKKLIDYE